MLAFIKGPKRSCMPSKSDLSVSCPLKACGNDNKTHFKHGKFLRSQALGQELPKSLGERIYGASGFRGKLPAETHGFRLDADYEDLAIYKDLEIPHHYGYGHAMCAEGDPPDLFRVKNNGLSGFYTHIGAVHHNKMGRGELLDVAGKVLGGRTPGKKKDLGTALSGPQGLLKLADKDHPCGVIAAKL